MNPCSIPLGMGLLLLGFGLQAAPAPTPLPLGVPRDAADPHALTGPFVHCSVLRPAAAASTPSSPSQTDWLAANATVRAGGGWRAYAKEAAQGTAQQPRPAAPCAERAR